MSEERRISSRNPRLALTRVLNPANKAMPDFVRILRKRDGKIVGRELDLPIELIGDLVEDLLDYLYGGATEVVSGPSGIYAGRTCYLTSGGPTDTRVLRPCPHSPDRWDVFDESHQTNTGCTVARIREMYSPLPGDPPL